MKKIISFTKENIVGFILGVAFVLITSTGYHFYLQNEKPQERHDVIIKVYDKDGNQTAQWQDNVVITTFTQDKITFIQSDNFQRTLESYGGSIVVYQDVK